jgi:hypothetical protein
MNGLATGLVPRGLRTVTVALTVCSLLLFSGLSGCSSSTKTTASNVFKTIGAVCALVVAILADPSGADVAAFDPSQALVNLQLSNLTITSLTGSGTITVTDTATGRTLGQQTFGYVVRGTSVYAQNPTAVHNWLSQFSTAADVTVGIQVSPNVVPVTQGPVSATSIVEYDGATIAAATVSSSTPPVPPQCPPNEPCPVQPPQN